MIDRGTESERIRDQALELVLEIAMRPQDKDLRGKLEAWRRRSVEHDRAYRIAAEAWLLGGGTTDGDVARVDVERDDLESVRIPTAARGPLPPYVHGLHETRDRTAPLSRRPRRRAAALVVSAAAMMGIALLVAPAVRMQIQADYLTGVGEVRSFELDDGSRVDLDAESAIAIAYSSKGRSVELLAGNAFFEVRHRPDRPFTVQAPGLETEVVGTAFAVSQSLKSTIVEVESGSVAVKPTRDPDSSQTLEEGDRLILDEATGEARRSEVPLSDIAAWRRGLLLADRLPFGELLHELDRHHRGVIWVASRSLEQTDVTGVFDLRDPITTLIAAAETQNARVTRVSPFLLVVTQR